MPTIPAEGREEAAPSNHLSKRQSVDNSPRYGGGQYNITPSMLSFLAPLFLIVIVGPLIFLFIRKKRRQQAMQTIVSDLRATNRSSAAKKTPAISHEEARQRLDGAAEISETDAHRQPSISTLKPSDEDLEKGGGAHHDTLSIGERDCAICLSALSSTTLPIPPPPAAVLPRPSSSPPPPSIPLPTSPSASAPETPAIQPPQDPSSTAILRLKICHHEFHDACLLSWCVLGKVSCPVCRAVFFETGKEAGKGENETDGEDGGDASGSGTSARVRGGANDAVVHGDATTEPTTAPAGVVR
ncbi:unnamed protein product [Periconia digitata]|uniref:RING-type domain-containing protein n=1 Tax=Periconia digitata TaxID=1303443 RepID=A0A9W4XW23_9PLEO|nr:unnamed protein product [Periconia digitata]